MTQARLQNQKEYLAGYRQAEAQLDSGMSHSEASILGSGVAGPVSEPTEVGTGLVADFWSYQYDVAVSGAAGSDSRAQFHGLEHTGKKAEAGVTEHGWDSN